VQCKSPSIAPNRVPSRDSAWLVALILLAYVVLLVVGEAVLVWVGPIPSVVVHSVLLLVLLNHYAFSGRDKHQGALLALCLVPLLRILSLTMSFPKVPPSAWIVFAEAPLIVGMIAVIRITGLSLNVLRMRRDGLLLQVLIALAGIPLSFLGLVVMHPAVPIVADRGWQSLSSAVAVLALSALVEECLFRFVLPHTLSSTFGAYSVLPCTLLFASTYLGSLSPAYVLFAGFTGLLFGLCVHRTRSLWGVIAAHGLIGASFVLFAPG